MISDNREHSPSINCSEIRDALEHRFDGEARSLSDDTLDRHVEGCDECAEHARDLQSIRSMVRALPETPFPADALDEVLRETVDQPVEATPLVFVRRNLVNLALAAVLTLAAVGAWFATNGGAMTEDYSEAELVRLEQDLNEIMIRLGATLRESEQVAVHKVLIDEAAPPLQHSPFAPPPPRVPRFPPPPEIPNPPEMYSMTPTPTHSPHARLHRLSLVALLASLVLCTSAFGSDDKAKKHRGYVQTSTFVDLVDSDGRLIEVAMDRKLLRLFSGRAIRRHEPVIADLLGDLVAINAVIGEVTEYREETEKEIEDVQKMLEAKGWERFVRVREPGSGDFAAWILADEDDEEEVDGLVVIGFQDNDEMMFVNLCGRIDMEKIAMLGDEMGLPGLNDLPSRSEVEKQRREAEESRRGDASGDDDDVIAPLE